MDSVQSWLDAEEVRRMAESLMVSLPEVEPLAADAGYDDSFEGFASASPSLAKTAESQLAPVDGRPHVQGNTTPPAAPQPLVRPDTSSESFPAPDRQEEETRRAVMGNALAGARRVAEGSGMLQRETSQPTPPADQASAAPAPPQVVKREPHQPSEPQKPEPHTARSPFLARLQNFSATLRRELKAKAMFLIDNEGQILLDEVENPKLIQVARTLANASYTAGRQTAGSAAVGNLHVKIGASATLEVVPVRSRYGLLILGVIFPAPLGAERVQQVAELLYQTVEPTEDH